MAEFPKRTVTQDTLKNSPLAEVAAEVRFAPKGHADFTPGTLIQAFGANPDTVEALALSQFPAQVRDANADLRYAALYRVMDGEHTFQFGPRVASVVTRAYPGWSAFRSKLHRLLTALKAPAAVAHVERIGLRYVNFLPGAGFEALRVAMSVADEDVTRFQSVLHYEIPDGPYRTIVKVSNAATRPAEHGQTVGTLVDIDTVRTFEDGFEISVEQSLLSDAFDTMHEKCKARFVSVIQPDLYEELRTGATATGAAKEDA